MPFITTTNTVTVTVTVIFFFLFMLPSTLSQNTTFNFSSFTLRNITLLGDSFLRNGVVGLTRSTTVPASSAGSFIYNNPINTTTFTTTFSFSITNTTGSSGNGFAFFLSPFNRLLGIPGSLPNSSEPNRFVAVEFDTRFNHVGLDLNTLDPVRTDDLTLQGIDLKSGKLITSWIDYNSDKKKLSAFLTYSGSSNSSKPEKPVLSVDVDLSEYFKEILYVGFSGSTEGSTELYEIVNWSFELFEFLVPQKPSLVNHHNVSGSGSTVSVAVKDVPASKNSTKNRKRFVIGVGVAIAGPAFFCVVLLVLGYVSFRKWNGVRKQKKSFRTGFVGCPKEFDYKELKLATRGFHVSRIIGNGSFGTVYKALFVSSGTIAAVKRSRHSHEGKTEFLSELSIIAGLRHKNLVQLQGWCVEKGELLLVYEFMPNGSLDKILYQESECSNFLLSWFHRLNIAIGLASVLSYLHQECDKRVIHRDIKTGNILLDGNFNPRLGDFGLAKLMDHDKSPVSTLTAGTMGYLAPEYLQYGKANDKTDVFSYGVVVLEVACGRRPIEREGQEMVNLVDWVWGLHSQGKIIEAADKRLNGEFQEEEMRKLLLLGLSCANPDSDQRPSMRRVLQILNNEAVQPLVVPKVKPSLTFSYSLPLSLDEIVSDTEEEFNSSHNLCEIKID
ncbi:probable L-type lectin-domain containing receptor kinase S.7 [Gastrolobium bilobum]|uniref:probable L-type lectin-domain containing receptor kinase S.7 n=1 Tax=Gastrolobium bilobum TaxID=150636 RepID=UPI002AB13AB1|nr:probable L-type lectin-domain containing receptor kinase S.7 [Gastrolobium bilobum]